MYLSKISIDELNYSDNIKKELSVFHQIEFLKLYIPHIHIVGIFNQNNERIGLFYYFKKTKYFIQYIIPPPFHPNNGLTLKINSKKEETKNSTIKKLQQLIHQYFQNEEFAHYTRFVLPYHFIDTQVFHWNNWRVKVHYTYHINLEASENNLFENLSSEKRKSIRKAHQDGIIVKETNEYSSVKNLVFKTFQRQNKKINPYYLNKILDEWATPYNSFAYLAYKNDKPIATTFCVYDTSTAYYLLGGYDDSHTHHGAGTLCMWNSILKSKKMGLKKFDFEGSMIPSVERFFRDFGGTLVPYYVCEKWRLIGL